MSDAENSQQKQRGKPFPPGVSGNPTGRRKGSRNKASVLAQQLIDGECERLVRAVIEKALEGDTTAQRICVERLLAPRREAPLSVNVPRVKSAADIPRALESITSAATNGTLLPGEAEKLASLLDLHRKSLETLDFEARLSVLESRIGKT